MLGLAAAYDEVPYFYSDQYELVIEYSGHVAPGGYNEAVFRGDKDQLKCIVFWLKDHKVLAAMNINVWDQTDTIKTLVRSGQPVDTAALADTGTPLADVLAATGTPNAQKSGADRTGPES
ncbi:oxidoreductase C-terminal domain-containing protein [Arthrobacter livingstonensis]|uniref:oxidoreductase C-terminal domain-containing protein n=1 Tax=Arthrobacter livingstonensis TaxID=670078 RepID=UPI0034D359EA